MEAEALYRRQDYQQAWQRYEAYLQSDPKGRYAQRARLRKAEILGLMGDWSGSLAQYEALLSEDLDRDAALQARYGIGRAYFKLDQHQQASRVLEGLLAANPPASLRFSGNALLTEIYLKQGRVQQAFAHLRLADPDLSAGDQEWFNYLKTRLVEQATAEELEQLVSLYRDSPLTAPLLLRLAQLAQEQGRNKESRKWLQLLKERFPQSQEARYAEKHLAPRRAAIGCLLPLSGDVSVIGLRIRQGMELAAQGAPVELVFKDCPGDRDICVQGLRGLADNPNLLTFVGPLSSAEAESAAQSAQNLGIPLIALSQKPGLTQAGDKIFQISLMAKPQVQRLVGYTSNSGVNRYASFAPNSGYGHTFSKLFQEEISLRGAILAAQEVYPPGTRDFTLALSPLLAKFQPGTEGSPSFEALFIPDDAPTVAAILRQLADHPLRQVKVLGTNLMRPTVDQKKLAQDLEGVIFTDAFFADDPNPAVQSYVAAFRRRYGGPPDYLSTQGYVAVRLIIKVLESEPSLSRADFSRKLQSLAAVPELPWFLGFSPDRQADLALYLLTIKNGQVQQAAAAPAIQSPR
ncbi:MAG: penicillin-binding protein activator [Deltaproteobacteria bacterium]|nr:penicillin-binding protein activator [Deltaproteobacteria bacterium]